MKFVALCLALVLVAACSGTGGSMHPAASAAVSPTMPPARMASCSNSALLDERCTRQWYACADGREVCTRHWEDCCRSTEAGH